ncbi:hypothetical protein B0I32_101672 [Nonomuraea fuscirosea]|uniref:Uncharacterized protein n=1 Tax=Nonomuraea fuscirosea TaxID=1291556 RepID=A0A2T0NC67_9ACTN|nr:hypothetical protein [Nonomuraea fuscirosea]PRX70577.1 hypothetical protein B0I32_101672 [Nonomuraea fuscirosea]
MFLDRHATDDMLDYAAIAEEELARDHDYRAELAAVTGFPSRAARGGPPPS